MQISIIIPVYNRADRIAATIRSIGLASHPQCELIVVDDGSSDESASVACATLDQDGLGSRSQVLRQLNGGPGSARNAAAAKATGQFLAFLDSDDRWLPWTVPAISDAINQHPLVPILFLQTVDVAPDEDIADLSNSEPVKALEFADYTAAATAQWGLRYGACNLVMRRDVFLSIGGFSSTERNAEDSDLILRSAGFGPCVVLTRCPLVVHAKGSEDALTADLDGGIRGLEFCLSQYRSGEYPDTVVSPLRIFAWSAITLIRKAFKAGEVRRAYSLLARYSWIICRGGAARKLVRLVLTPALVRAP
ncbi:glycosyltransferase family 2 protein [Sulfitobacter sp. S223]|uniref:glycosyltransferase family 2 protein n=1 Tax=Sulfitobacter sp. S223 TaxID=2867023 RepID=UPI0021A8AAC0|nr:glycosyltransferase family A protein [Sulfitobacter sp. S223]UWR28186.1 glycosyltransferase family 2 protein [Sulfitobacter sp. S223]